jgi:beta-galactosidase GanA
MLPVMSSAATHVQRFSDLGGKPYSVGYDSRSIRVDGKPVLLLSGSIHYVRSTPLQWPALFAEAKANGLNTIESYAFWSWHARGGPPPEEGSAAAASYYDYSGSGNVTRFLELAAAHDLWVVWRFGPYVCAEWPGGGLPTWLRSVPGLKSRQYNQPWIDAVERWGRDHKRVIEPYLAENGGPIIMSQIENEYGGSDMRYFEWMTSFTRRLLPHTPWVMCGHVSACILQIRRAPPRICAARVINRSS